jgi:tetrapyrrole methylase family protein/MazG family protein
MKSSQQGLKDLGKLLEIIRKLRSPEGCPWDKKQKKEDIAKYLLEEAYEVLDAIEGASPEALKEELGDLFFQILFLTVIAEERQEFNFSDVMKDIGRKMIRRHPHVFGDKKVTTVEEVKVNWQQIKREIENKGDGLGFFDNIPRSLPALTRAQKITEKASTVGFDWSHPEEVLQKIEEELTELKTAFKTNQTKDVQEEIGDLLFSLVNLSRFVQINAEEALRNTIKKFTERFAFIESRLSARGKALEEASLEEMDQLWNDAKMNESRKP